MKKCANLVKIILKDYRKNQQIRPIVPLLKVEKNCGSSQAHNYVAFFKHLQTAELPMLFLNAVIVSAKSGNVHSRVDPVCLHVSIPQTYVRHLICKGINFRELMGRTRMLRSTSDSARGTESKHLQHSQSYESGHELDYARFKQS